MPPDPNCALVVELAVAVAIVAVVVVLLLAVVAAVFVIVVVELMGVVPIDEAFESDRADNGTGISCERSVRLELCILTASDIEDKSAGSGVSSDRRVIVREHSLEKGRTRTYD